MNSRTTNAVVVMKHNIYLTKPNVMQTKQNHKLESEAKINVEFFQNLLLIIF